MNNLCILAMFVVIFLVCCAYQSQQVKITIEDFSFSPHEITIKEGTTITWINKGHEIHDITIDSGLFDHDLNPGEKFSFTFNETGNYSYHCDIHPSMKGNILVTE